MVSEEKFFTDLARNLEFRLKTIYQPAAEVSIETYLKVTCRLYMLTYSYSYAGHVPVVILLAITVSLIPQFDVFSSCKIVVQN